MMLSTFLQCCIVIAMQIKLIVVVVVVESPAIAISNQGSLNRDFFCFVFCFVSTLKPTLSCKLSDSYSAFLFVRSFEIEECLNCECDSFSATNSYEDLRTGRCGRYSPDYLNYYNRFQGTEALEELDGQNVYLRFKTDDSIHHSGIKISFIVKSDSRKLMLRSHRF